MKKKSCLSGEKNKPGGEGGFEEGSVKDQISDFLAPFPYQNCSHLCKKVDKKKQQTKWSKVVC